MKSFFAKLSLVAFALGLVAAGRADDKSPPAEAKPQPADIEQALNHLWAHPATPMDFRTSVRLNSVKIGGSAKANDGQVLEGLPTGATIWVARVDFTVLTHEPKVTRTIRRVRVCSVYKDQLDEWNLQSGSPVGADVTGEEPPSS